MDATPILTAVGEDGKFQLIFLVCTQCLRILSLWNSYFMAFGLYQPSWLCLEELESKDNNPGIKNDLSVLKPPENDTLNRYSGAYGNDVTDSPLDKAVVSGGTFDWNISLECTVHQTCQDVIFEPGSSTIVTEWDLICEAGWAASLIITIQMLGYLIGCLFGGQIGERFGRKTTLYGATVILSCVNILCVFSPRWEVYAAFRALIGLSAGAIVTTCLVFSVEFVGQTGRAALKIFPALGISSSIFALQVYFIRDWKTLHIVSGVAAGIFCLPALWLPESIRWLFVQGKAKKVEEAARKISRVNGQKTLPPGLVFKRSGTHKERTYSYRDLFQGWRQSRITISISIIWAVRDLVHYMIGFGVKSFAGDFFINFLIYSFCEIPVFLLVAPTVRFLGNRHSASLFFSLSFVACISVIVVHFTAPSDVKDNVITYVALVAKISVSACNQINGVYTSELFPTVIRGVGLGFAIAMGIIGGAVAPFLIPSSKSFLPVSFAVAGGFLLLVCILLQTLPETKARPLQDYTNVEKNPTLSRDSNEEKNRLFDQ